MFTMCAFLYDFGIAVIKLVASTATSSKDNFWKPKSKQKAAPSSLDQVTARAISRNPGKTAAMARKPEDRGRLSSPKFLEATPADDLIMA